MEYISLEDKIEFIESSSSLEQVQKSGVLPDPDALKGYYFVSYSHKDYKVVFKHVLRLLEQGINLWYDRGLEAGKSWREDVKRKIYSYNCKGVICFLSANCIGSESLLQEYDMIRRFNKPMVAVEVDSSIFDSVEDAFVVDGVVDENAFGCWFKQLSEASEQFPALPNGKTVSKDIESLLMAIAKIKRRRVVSEDCTVEELIKVLRALPPPRLFRYSKSNAEYGCVMITGINDISVRRVKMPARFGKNNLPVAGVESGGLANCIFLEEVVMPNTWQWILEFAFYNCKNLRKVDFGTPNDGRIIYLSAFDGCKSLKELTIPGVHTVGAAQYVEKITFTGEASFILQGSKRLREVRLDDAKEIWEDALEGCEAIEEFTIPSNCKKIGDRAFSRTAIRSLRFPEEVKLIGTSACSGCEQLESIEIACRGVVIGENAFCDCIKLEKAELNNVLRLDSKAFYRCSKLSEVVIKGKDVTIYDDAFADCPSLKRVILNIKKATCVTIDNETVHTETFDAKEVFPFAERIYFKDGSDGLNFDGFSRETSDMEGYELWLKEQ